MFEEVPTPGTPELHSGNRMWESAYTGGGMGGQSGMFADIGGSGAYSSPVRSKEARRYEAEIEKLKKENNDMKGAKVLRTKEGNEIKYDDVIKIGKAELKGKINAMANLPTDGCVIANETDNCDNLNTYVGVLKQEKQQLATKHKELLKRVISSVNNQLKDKFEEDIDTFLNNGDWEIKFYALIEKNMQNLTATESQKMTDEICNTLKELLNDMSTEDFKNKEPVQQLNFIRDTLAQLKAENEELKKGNECTGDFSLLEEEDPKKARNFFELINDDIGERIGLVHKKKTGDGVQKTLLNIKSEKSVLDEIWKYEKTNEYNSKRERPTIAGAVTGATYNVYEDEEKRKKPMTLDEKKKFIKEHTEPAYTDNDFVLETFPLFMLTLREKEDRFKKILEKEGATLDYATNFLMTNAVVCACYNGTAKYFYLWYNARYDVQENLNNLYQKFTEDNFKDGREQFFITTKDKINNDGIIANPRKEGVSTLFQPMSPFIFGNQGPGGGGTPPPAAAAAAPPAAGGGGGTPPPAAAAALGGGGLTQPQNQDAAYQSGARLKEHWNRLKDAILTDKKIDQDGKRLLGKALDNFITDPTDKNKIGIKRAIALYLKNKSTTESITNLLSHANSGMWQTISSDISKINNKETRDANEWYDKTDFVTDLLSIIEVIKNNDEIKQKVTEKGTNIDDNNWEKTINLFFDEYAFNGFLYADSLPIVRGHGILHVDKIKGAHYIDSTFQKNFLATALCELVDFVCICKDMFNFYNVQGKTKPKDIDQYLLKYTFPAGTVKNVTNLFEEPGLFSKTRIEDLISQCYDEGDDEHKHLSTLLDGIMKYLKVTDEITPAKEDSQFTKFSGGEEGDIKNLEIIQNMINSEIIKNMTNGEDVENALVFFYPPEGSPDADTSANIRAANAVAALIHAPQRNIVSKFVIEQFRIAQQALKKDLQEMKVLAMSQTADTLGVSGGPGGSGGSGEPGEPGGTKQFATLDIASLPFSFRLNT